MATKLKHAERSRKTSKSNDGNKKDFFNKCNVLSGLKKEAKEKKKGERRS